MEEEIIKDDRRKRNVIKLEDDANFIKDTNGIGD